MNWWKRLWRREQMEQELEKELRFHLEEHAKDLVEQGYDREEARRLGITQFEMSSGLNDSSRFIGALAQLVQDALVQPAHSLIPIQSAGRQLAEPQYAAAAGLD